MVRGVGGGAVEAQMEEFQDFEHMKLNNLVYKTAF